VWDTEVLTHLGVLGLEWAVFSFNNGVDELDRMPTAGTPPALIGVGPVQQVVVKQCPVSEHLCEYLVNCTNHRI